MMQKRVNSLLIVGIIGTVVLGFHFGVQYGRAMWGNSHIWWTPKAMAVSLDETRQYFELFLSDELLQDHLKRRSLSATERDGKTYQVVPEDIKIRLNNWYRVKASFLNSAVFSAFVLGISVTCLIMGLARLRMRRESNSE
jgi:hypothetical protein